MFIVAPLLGINLICCRNAKCFPGQHKIFVPTANIILNDKRLTESFLPQIRNETRCPLVPLLLNIILEVLAKAVGQENEIKSIPIEKEKVK